MSNIVIVIKESKLEVAVLGKLRTLLSSPLTQIKSALVEGKPILEMELFDNKYDEKASLLRGLIDLVRKNDLHAEVYELPSGQSFETSSVRKQSLIQLDVLENILNSADDEAQRDGVD